MNIKDFNFKGKTAFVRVDFNVPLDDNGHITDDTRMRAALPTLQKILSDGGRLVIASHLGRPKGKSEALSLKHIVPHLEELLGQKVHFVNDCIGSEVTRAVEALRDGDALLLENLRFYAEEEGKPRGLAEDASDEVKKEAKAAVKKGQKEFAKKLADLADIYVNDAFGTAHRAHASTALMAEHFDREHKCFGFLMEKEVNAVNRVMGDIRHPFVAIMGGAKVSSKIEIIDSLLDKVDRLILTGGMVFTFVAAHRGKIGKSLCEEDKFDVVKAIERKAKERGVQLLLATDCVAATEFAADAPADIYPADAIPNDRMGLDVGPDTAKSYADALEGAQTILWNGPCGVFEMEPFRKGSEVLGKAIAAQTKKGAYSLVGGGDTVALVHLLGLADQVSYVSTGGGALLEAIEGKQLPGVAAIEA